MGIVMVMTQQTIEPGVFSWTTGTTLLVMVALGGRFTFFGPIVGVLFLELTRSTVQRYSSHGDLIVGALVAFCAMAFPEGIVPRLEGWLRIPRAKTERDAAASAPRPTRVLGS
jgi:branched-chain amino acid transport system permease protein